ncbi:AAA family ATPase [Nocardia takedensis]
MNPGQVAVIESFAAAGMAEHTANAAAGTGKTTAMADLTTAWKSAGGTVIGMAPTAAAANLGEAIGARAETIDKLLHVLDSHYPGDPMRDHPPSEPTRSCSPSLTTS